MASAAAVAAVVRATEQSVVMEMALTCQRDLQESTTATVNWVHKQGWKRAKFRSGYTHLNRQH